MTEMSKLKGIFIVLAGSIKSKIFRQLILHRHHLFCHNRLYTSLPANHFGGGWTVKEVSYSCEAQKNVVIQYSIMLVDDLSITL